MPPARSRRLRLLESLRRTISEMLHDRVRRIALSRGQTPPPNTTGAIYTLAEKEAPDLLDQLLCVHQRTRQETGEEEPQEVSARQLSEMERRRMLSAVRAAVERAQTSLGT